MKIPEVRKLIGKRVQWETRPDPHRGTYSVRTGVIVDVMRKNVLVEHGGTSDWKWLPDMNNLKPIEAAETETK
ncbi:hypothetical protein [Nevskia ramosa]|uniref:hypothetical protein n=1 Tax=Nevskia ramosa TaxID=64002 RepID=UPI003D135FE5